MSELPDGFEIRHDLDNNEFLLLAAESEIGELSYRLRDDTMIITHTGVRPAYRTQGLARHLVLAARDYADAERLSINPLCWYAAQVLRQ